MHSFAVNKTCRVWVLIRAMKLVNWGMLEGGEKLWVVVLKKEAGIFSFTLLREPEGLMTVRH